MIRTLLLFCCLALCTQSAGAAANRPNILLILADDVGCDAIGCYGGESYKTPHIDALAQGGMRFTHCYSMPVCHPSRICLLTGKYPAALGNPKWGSFPSDQEAKTFASVLRKGGYATAIAGKWQLCLLKEDPQQPKRMGFDEWSLFGWHEGPRYQDPLIYQNGHVRSDTVGKYGPDLYVDFLIDFMQRNQSGPFFAYYSMALCHDVTNDLGEPVPYGPQGRWMNYEEMAHDMDRQVGRLVAALDRLNLRDNTLILFTGDNGTAARSILKYEDGEYVRPKVFSKFKGRLVQGGKGELTDWGTHVPLIANWPGHVPADKTSDDLVDFSDFLPTLAAVADVSLPQGVMLDGHSFATALLGDGHTSRTWAYAERKTNRHFVRTQRYKLYSSGEFFDIESDVDEKHPIPETKLTAEQRQIREKLQSALKSLSANS